jgi:hypothetical protein
MGDIFYCWDCKNPECESVNNKVPKHIVERSIIMKKPLRVFCAICGFSPFARKIRIRDRSGSAVHTCDCIPFEGPESILPLSKLSNGLYKDCDGDLHDLIHFLRMGINPDTYLKWVFHGKPNHKDLDKIDAK